MADAPGASQDPEPASPDSDGTVQPAALSAQPDTAESGDSPTAPTDAQAADPQAAAPQPQRNGNDDERPDSSSGSDAELLPRSNVVVVKRPDSAQVAELIEGYHDDFLKFEDEGHPLDSQDGETVEACALEPAPELLESCPPGTGETAVAASGSAPSHSARGSPPDSPAISSVPSPPATGGADAPAALAPSPSLLRQDSEAVRSALAQQAKLVRISKRLQQHVVVALNLRQGGKAGGDDGGEDNSLGTAEARYLSLQQRLQEQQAKLQERALHYDREVDELRETLQQRLAHTTEIQNMLRHFVVEIGKSAEYSGSCKPIRAKLVEKLHTVNLTRDEKLTTVRLENIELHSQMERLQQVMKEQEQLASGLHIIDFEQLKIENQSMVEKIEERTEELVRVKRRLSVAVQMLTHMREKRRFLQLQSSAIQVEMQQVDARMHGARDTLGKVRLQRDRLRRALQKERDSALHLENVVLMQDMTLQIQLRDRLKQDIESLMERKAAAEAKAMRTKHVILNLSRRVNASGNGGLTR